MSGTWETAFWLVLVAVWYLLGRSDGRNVERKRARPYLLFAAPVFRALRIDGAARCTITITRDSENEWTAHQVTTTAVSEAEEMRADRLAGREVELACITAAGEFLDLLETWPLGDAVRASIAEQRVALAERAILAGNLRDRHGEAK